MRYDPPLKKALKAAGGVTALAGQLGIVPSAIPQWRRAPAHHCLAIAKLTGISPHELRPDIFGAAPVAAPERAAA